MAPNNERQDKLRRVSESLTSIDTRSAVEIWLLRLAKVLHDQADVETAPLVQEAIQDFRIDNPRLAITILALQEKGLVPAYILAMVLVAPQQIISTEDIAL